MRNCFAFVTVGNFTSIGSAGLSSPLGHESTVAIFLKRLWGIGSALAIVVTMRRVERRPPHAERTQGWTPPRTGGKRKGRR